jgi:two-component system response regulator WspF
MRIGIANDLPMAVELLRRVIAQAAEHEVAWIALNGREAVEACRRDLPDLVLMDLAMPEMGGVEATKRIMVETPCPILLVTASIDANVAGTYEAMGYGALDAVDIPTVGPTGGGAQAELLLSKIAMLGRLMGDAPAPKRAPRQEVRDGGPPRRLIAIGASAGGPAAVAAILGGLPRDIAAALVLVQHLDEKFVPGLANWLAQHTDIPIRLAREGDTPETGVLLIAASSDHLIFKSPVELGYTREPRDLAYRPSADVFFESVVAKWTGEVIGVLLTGMGRDGAQGLKLLRNAAHFTIAQDQATSAVYGMPKAASAIDAAVEILPLDEIADRLVAICGISVAGAQA